MITDPISRREYVRYESTLDENVQIALRWFRKSPQMRRLRRRQIISVGAWGGLGCTVVVWAQTLWPGAALLTGAIIGFVFALAYIPIYDFAVRYRTKRLIRESWGGRDKAECEVELRPDSMWARTAGVEFALPWRSAVDVENRDDGVEVTFQQGLIVAMARAFDGPVAQRRFAEAARQWIAASHDGQEPA